MSAWRAANASDLLACLICCAVALVCILVAHPFRPVAFDDDWSYSHLALRFAQTGRIRYDGWGSPTVLFQVLWAAAWLRVFPFSFDLLRCITLPFSLGFVAIVYLLARQIGLRQDLSLFAALTVGASPLFLPLEASFMSDPYGCFFSTLCLYAAVRCVRAQHLRAGTCLRGSIGWIWLLSVAGILGGSDRQTVWVAPLTLIPVMAWIQRRERLFLMHAAGAYCACLISLAALTTHFGTGYAVYALRLGEFVRLLGVRAPIIAGTFVTWSLTGVLYAFPALACFAAGWRRLPAKTWGVLLVASVAATGAAVLLLNGAGVVPLSSGVQTPFGVLSRSADALGFKPVLLAPGVRFAVTSALVFGVGMAFVLSRGRGGALPAPVRLMFAAYGGVYLALLMPGFVLGITYDRYLLPLLPLLLIVVLARVQAAELRIPTLAWGAWAALAVYGVVTTHDYAESARARTQAAEELARDGVSRNAISAGLEYDAWTQLERAGRITGVRYGDRFEWNYTSQFWFWHYATEVHPEYVVRVLTRPADSRSLPVEALHAWTPPFQRFAVVQKRVNVPEDPLCSTAMSGCGEILKKARY